MKSDHPSNGIYARLQLLSLDVAAGALAGGCMAARYLDVEMPWSWYVILPLAVWTIYTGDHLLDARRLGAAASTLRHRYHHQHFKILLALSILAATTAVALALRFLGPQGFYFGLSMGAIVLLHFVIVKFVGERTSPLLMKELGVALVYAVGIWGLPMIFSGKYFTRGAIGPLAQFMLLALVNLLEFSLYEYESDKADGQTSFVQAIGPRRAIRFIRLILAMVVGLGAFLLADGEGKPLLRLEMVFAVMATVLAALIYKPGWFLERERYRLWGDGVFFIPFLYLILSAGS